MEAIRNKPTDPVTPLKLVVAQSTTIADLQESNRDFEERVFECPDCEDSGFVETENGVDHEGRPCYGLVICPCRQKKILREKFLQAVGRTPKEDFGWITDGLNSIEPNDTIHPKQSKALLFLKANKGESFYFHGITGAGKSAYAWALWQEAAREGYQLEAQKGNQLIKAFRDAEFGQFTKAKLYNLAQLEEGKWCVLIDEFDKIKLTEYSLQTLFNILDTLKTHGHRILITAKKSLAEVENEWLAKDADGKFDAENFAADIRRRMSTKCIEIDLRLADCDCGKVSYVEGKPNCVHCGAVLTKWRRY